MHSYSTPAILVLPIESVEQTYLSWILAETKAAAEAGERVFKPRLDLHLISPSSSIVGNGRSPHAAKRNAGWSLPRSKNPDFAIARRRRA